jgi:AAA+ ATPase superfamily predicted ATPase
MYFFEYVLTVTNMMIVYIFEVICHKINVVFICTSGNYEDHRVESVMCRSYIKITFEEKNVTPETLFGDVLDMVV